MARFRLKIAHVIKHSQFDSEVLLPGDKENSEQGLGEEKGTIVGDGTPYKVVDATLEMEPLDDEAKAMIAAEVKRLEKSGGSMNPLEQLAKVMNIPTDDYEKSYLPGFDGRPRPQPQPATSSGRR